MEEFVGDGNKIKMKILWKINYKSLMQILK